MNSLEILFIRRIYVRKHVFLQRTTTNNNNGNSLVGSSPIGGDILRERQAQDGRGLNL